MNTSKYFWFPFFKAFSQMNGDALVAHRMYLTTKAMFTDMARFEIVLPGGS